MRLSSTGSSLAVGLTLQASTIQAWGIADRIRVNYYSGGLLTPVPSYNISMPVDHFTPSDARTFNNRFFVNDTYYKPGGPVIFFDFGEVGVDIYYASVFMGDYGDGAVSAALELAKSRGGVVVGWEHRYYGLSHPFPLTERTYDSSDYSTDGIPVGGAADYKYLTVAQSLEDVAYFARRFNQTQLDADRNAVLGGVNATRYLDPWHTPWIWVGGSYPGMRGTWMRLHNPDIIYAVWASSAPVQTVPEGSAYANSIYRALPRNCTADIQAAMSRMDQIVDGGNQTDMSRLAAKIRMAEYFASDNDDSKRRRSASARYDVEYFQPILAGLFRAVTSHAQSYGYTEDLQHFCDILESFNVASFLANSTSQREDDSAFLYNNGDSAPPEKGIAASSGERGGEVALAGYLYAIHQHFSGPSSKPSLKRWQSQSRPSSSSSASVEMDPWQDAHSWEWQVLSELGLVVSVNGSSPYRLGSRHVDYAYMRRETIERYFANFTEADIPGEPDADYPQGFGGWRMQPSNTMFTNGEFDPWRAYGVSSLERELADYPAYGGMVQDVPACGVASSMGEHFGTVVSSSLVALSVSG